MKLPVALLLVPFLFQSRDTNQLSPNNTDSLAQVYSYAFAHFSPPQLTARKQLLRLHQRMGYASALTSIFNDDGFLALLSYIRTRLQIEYSLPHGGVTVDISAQPLPKEQSRYLNNLPGTKFTIRLPQVPNGRETIVLNIDWSFPPDPWKRD